MLTHVFPRSRDDSVAPFLWNFLEALSQRNIETVVLAPHNKGLKFHEKHRNYRIRRFRYAPDCLERLAYRGQMHELVLKSVVNKFLFLSYCFTNIISLIRVIREEKPDLVHVHWWIPNGFIMWIVSFLTKTPYIITSHGTDVFILRKFRFLLPLAGMIFSRAKRIQVISSYVRDELVSLFPNLQKNVDIISMPIRETELPQRDAVFHGNGHVLGIGRLIERKGFGVLLRAVAKTPEEISLTLVGKGPLRGELGKLSRDLGIDHRVRFIDEVIPSKLPQLFSDAEMLVLPSITDWKGETEGLGMVLLESLWMGVPVIASETGGVTDIVQNGVSGLTFPEGSVDELAGAIVKMHNFETHHAMATGGQKRYLDCFSRDLIAQKALISYTGALSGPAEPFTPMVSPAGRKRMWCRSS